MTSHDTDDLTPPAEDELRGWIRAARDGSETAHDRLFELCRDYLLNVANQEVPSDLRPKVAPSDLVQLTFLEAHRDFAAFRGQQGGEFVRWLRKILLNNLANATRDFRGTQKRALGREIPLDRALSDSNPAVQLRANGHSPVDHAAQNEHEQQLEEALAALPEDYAQAIRLRHHEDLTFREIGERMGRGEDAARKLWARAIDFLRLEMGQADDG